jgi:hypothetical protein
MFKQKTRRMDTRKLKRGSIKSGGDNNLLKVETKEFNKNFNRMNSIITP